MQIGILLGRHLYHLMVDLQLAGSLKCIGRLIQGIARSSDGERVDTAAKLFGGPADQAGIDPPAQKGADRNIRLKA